MFWVIRGTDPRSNEDFAMVVEAQSVAAAETWAVKRGIPYIILDEASEQDIEDARCAKRLWKHSPERNFTCFGQPVPQGQLTCLMVAGIATILLLARVS